MRPRKQQRHLPKCVYHKHGAYYFVKNGKWEKIGTDLNEALQAYAKLINPMQNDFALLLDKATPHLLDGKSEGTQKQYKHAIKHLKSIFADFNVKQIKRSHLIELLDHLKETPGKSHLYKCVLKMFFMWLLDREYVDIDPAYKLPSIKYKPRDRLVTHEEYRKIYTHADTKLQCIMDLCYLTGQRIGDILNIKKEDLKEEGIYFKQQKTNHALIIEWTPHLKEVIQKIGVEEDCLTKNKQQRKLSYRKVIYDFDMAKKKANVLDVHIHDLRALSGTDADNAGLNPSQLLGHANPQTTKIYLRDKTAKVVKGPSKKIV